MIDLETEPPPEQPAGRRVLAGWQRGLLKLSPANGAPASAGAADQTNPASETPRRFERGDEVELGQDLAEALGGRDHAVSDLGEVHSALSGPTWEPIAEPELRRRAQRYAGASRKKGATPDGEQKWATIRLSASAVRGIVASAQDALGSPGFFARAPLGAAFADTFVRVEGSRLVREALEPSHRVRAHEAAPWSLPEPGGAHATYKFLAETWAGCDDAAERLDYLLEWLGLALLGLTTEYKDSPLLVGAKDTGKSRLLDVISGCFPKESRRSIPLHSLTQDYHRASLAGARLNVVAELPARELMDGEAAKALLAGDPVSARHPHGRVFTLESRCAHLFACNELPPSLDAALMERFVVLGCHNVVPVEKQDRSLAARLAAEAPAFAADALSRVEGVLQRGFLQRPPSSHHAAHSWATMSDPVRQWAEEHLEADEAGRVKSAELYGRFVLWAEANGHKRMSNVRWTGRMGGLGFGKFKSDGMRWRVREIGTAEARGREHWSTSG